ncbi:MAG: cytochrome c biogenesis protein ResB, partial [Planctomycetota bacterium]
MASVPSELPIPSTRPSWTLRTETSVLSPAALLSAFGSLKMTVSLFGLSIVLVLVGTLAQDEMNMQEVKERYFLSWIAPLHIDDFFPQAFYRHETPFRLVLPVPGGALVGTLLMLNLVAAKLTRFRLQASGGRLVAGMAFLIAGAAVAAAVVFLGHSDDGLQGAPPISYAQLWAGILAITAVGAIGIAMASGSAKSKTMRWLGYVGATFLGVGVLLCLATGFQISDSGLRIVWQLAKGLGAGLIMLVGCQLAFGRQGGNVLLHLGVGLLMVGQFAFGDRQLEQRLSLIEGASTNTFVNLDQVELQIIETKDSVQDIVAVPVARLLSANTSSDVIDDDVLPFDIRVLAYYENSGLVDVPAENVADVGLGLQVAAVQKEKSGGADMAMNMPSAYIEILDRESKQPLGTYLVSQSINDRETLVPDGSVKDMMDTVVIGQREFEIGLRLHREVKPYWVQLQDVRRVTYSGTETPRDFSSFIRIVDGETGEDRKERVWMNNPLRYRGETFYQSNYQVLPGGKELTGIQVVRNSGWLIPYVACSITGLGMLVHFWGTLTRFIGRRRRELARSESFGEFDAGYQPTSQEHASGIPDSAAADDASRRRNWPVVLWVGGLAAVVAIVLLPSSAARNSLKPTQRDQSFNFADAGTIPVQFGGRIMPLDAYARQTMKAMTNKESLPLEDAPGAIKERVETRKLSAVQWLFEVAADKPNLRYLPMFRVDAEAVRSELDLQRRESKLYSLDDLTGNLDRFSQLVKEARQKDSINQDFKDKKLIELDMRTRQYTMAATAFRLPVPDPVPAEFFPEGTSEQTRQRFALQRLQQRMDSLKQMPAPALIPPTETVAAESIDMPDWVAFSPAFFDFAKNGLSDDEAPAGVRTFAEMLQAYGNEDPLAFNESVVEHLADVQSVSIPGYDHTAVALERWLGSASPTAIASALYILAIIMGLVGLAIHSPKLNSATWGTIVIAFIVHTIVIGVRVYITGRAPVINLYSSAVFIGWAAVLGGLAIERIFRYGTGNVLSAFAGVLTLWVAYNLTLNVG